MADPNPPQIGWDSFRDPVWGCRFAGKKPPICALGKLSFRLQTVLRLIGQF